MNAEIFVDTNVFVYRRDAAEKKKCPAAALWLAHLWKQRLGRTSLHVLGEYFAVVTRKLKPGLPVVEARADVNALLVWNPVATDRAMLESAWRLQDRYGLAWWDALVVAGAKASRCGSLLSEDFQDGADLDGVVVVNPFLHAPPA